MSGLFGIFDRRGDPADPDMLLTMRAGMSHWGPDGGHIIEEGACGLGHLKSEHLPEDRFESLPKWIKTEHFLFTATARLDNREELCRLFDLCRAESSTVPDSDLVLFAYQNWGKHAPLHLLGDWSFAAWHPEEQRLFIARDRLGHTAVHYYCNDRVFAFASSLHGLLALPDIPIELNELRFAQLMISWPGDGTQTIYQNIRRLPGAHTLEVTPEHFKIQQYWDPMDIPRQPIKTADDYAEGMLEIYKTAVKSRLRGEGPFGAYLSGGLDSGSVCALAAEELRKRNQTLTAFTSVPIYDTERVTSKRRFGDETEHAHATAEMAGLEHVLVPAKDADMAALLDELWTIFREPLHAAGNFYWILEIQRRAKQRGIKTLLSGQGGNGSVSWKGLPQSQPLLTLLGMKGGLKTILRDRILAKTVPGLLAWRHGRKFPDLPWLDYSYLSRDASERLQIKERMREAGAESKCIASGKSALDLRAHWFNTVYTIGGAIFSEIDAYSNVPTCDPTVDIRLVEFSLGIPDRFFMANGMDRYMIRRAIQSILPEKVRLNKLRGMQAGDSYERMRQNALKIDTYIDNLLLSRVVNNYIDTELLKKDWHNIKNKTNLSGRARVAFYRSLFGAYVLLKFST